MLKIASSDTDIVFMKSSGSQYIDDDFFGEKRKYKSTPVKVVAIDIAWIFKGTGGQISGK